MISKSTQTVPSALQRSWLQFNQIVSVLRFKPFDTSTEEGRAQERLRRIAWTGITLAAARFVTVVTSLVTVPLTLNYLGIERYSLWMTVSSFTALLAFADMGLGNGLLNSISEANGKDDRIAARIHVSSALAILSAIAAVLVGTILAIYQFIDWANIYQVNSPTAIAEAGPTTVVFVICFALNLPLSAVQRVQLGYQEGFANSLWQAGGSVLALGAVLLAVYLQAGLPWLVACLLGAPVLVLLAQNVRVYQFAYRWLRPSFSFVARWSMRMLFRLGLLFFLLQLSTALAYASDNLVAAQVLGPQAVAEYATAAKLAGMTSIVLSLLLLPLWPAYGEAVSRGDISWVQSTLFRSLAFSTSIAVVSALALVLFGKEVVAVWAGPSVVPSYSLLLGLGVWSILSAAGNAVAMLLNGTGIIKFQVVCASIMAVGALMLKITLAHSIGVAGIAWGTVIAYFVFVAVPMAVYVPRLLARLRTSGASFFPDFPNELDQSNTVV